MREYKILIIISAIIIIILAIFGFILLTKEEVEPVVKQYYGTYKLVDNNYIRLNEYVSHDYKVYETIEINKKNIENLSKPVKGLATCAYNIPSKDFAITTFNNKTEDCEKKEYLLTTLDQVIVQKGNKNDWKNKIICFDLEDDMLVQRDCNDDIKDVGIKYQKIK